MSPLQRKVIEISFALIEQNHSPHKHFTFLCEKNRILSVGMNEENASHPLAKKHNPHSIHIHSELSAYIGLRWRDIDWKRITLINTRVNAFYEIGMSKPCEGCTKLIRDVGIKNVWYTDRDFSFKYISLS